MNLINTNTDLSSNWRFEKKNYFTHDQVIEAYIKGKEAQRDQNIKVLIKELENNIKKASNAVERIHEYIVSLGFKSYTYYVRFNNIISFDVIFSINQEDYLSESFDKVYVFSMNLKRELNNETFNISFSFMPKSDSLNEKRLTSEGFLLRYEQ